MTLDSTVGERGGPTTGDRPTDEQPSTGTLVAFGSPLSEVAHWVEGDLHEFRSLEYDVIASGPDERSAISAFVDASADYARFLHDPAGDPTDEDRELAIQILDRLFEGYAKALEREAHRRLVVRLLRRRGDGAGRPWHLVSAQQT